MHFVKGEFSEGLMHGNGKYTWTDGIIYEVIANVFMRVTYVCQTGVARVFPAGCTLLLPQMLTTPHPPNAIKMSVLTFPVAYTSSLGCIYNIYNLPVPTLN